MLVMMADYFDPTHTVQTFEDAAMILTQKKIFASPAYWQEHAQPGRKCSGDNVRAVIRNFARAAK